MNTCVDCSNPIKSRCSPSRIQPLIDWTAPQIERRFEDKERDWLERVTTLEADLEGLRADKVETRGRLRRAEVSSPSSEVFER